MSQFLLNLLPSLLYRILSSFFFIFSAARFIVYLATSFVHVTVQCSYQPCLLCLKSFSVCHCCLLPSPPSLCYSPTVRLQCLCSFCFCFIHCQIMDFPCMPNNRKLMLHFLDQRYVSDQNDYKPLIKSRLLSSRIECHKQDILYSSSSS